MSKIESTIIRNLKETYCRLQSSKISGIGVFAIRDIPKSINPFPVIKNEKWYLISSSKLKGLDKEVMRMVDDFHILEKDGFLWISDAGLNGMNISFFVNNSKKPTLKHIPSGEFVTLKKIKRGEELTVAYETYDYKWEK